VTQFNANVKDLRTVFASSSSRNMTRFSGTQSEMRQHKWFGKTTLVVAVDERTPPTSEKVTQGYARLADHMQAHTNISTLSIIVLFSQNIPANLLF
jgi:hypothetical protein